MRRRRGLATAVGIGLLLTALSGCDETPLSKSAARPGTLIESSSAAYGVHTFVMTPDARLDLTVSAPSHDLSVYDEKYDHAADGASLVGVSWTWDFRTGVSASRNSERARVEPSISLVVGDRSYSLDDAMLTSRDEDPIESYSTVKYNGTVFVAVAGDPDDLSQDDVAVSVDYDGLVQTVGADWPLNMIDVGDTAAPLYRNLSDLGEHEVECGAPRYARDQRVRLSRPYCHISVAEVPYQQDAGWAAPDTSWLVVDVTLGGGATAVWPDLRDYTEVYRLEDGADAEITLGGAEAVAEVGSDRDEGTYRLVFAADAQDLVLKAVFDTSGSGEDGAPADPSVPVSWRIPIR